MVKKPEECPPISLCMIAKNEEEMLAQAIRSVQPIISEIILVDTGSTDNTVSIAEEFGAKVLFREWDDDFSAPRNLSIEHATGEWILVLDADEVIAESDLEALQGYTRNRKICYEFLQRHYSEDHRLSNYEPCTGEYPEWEKGHCGFFFSNLCRFFPHGEGIHYQGEVHELVEHSIREMGKHTVVRSPIPIHHYGHIQAIKDKKKKSNLYVPLGEIKTTENPTSWKNHYELAVEHNCNGRYEESIKSFEKALSLNPEYPQSWLNYGYVLCEMGRFQDAFNAQKRVLVLDPKNAEAHCNMGVVFMRVRNWQMAEQCFIRALSINNTYVNAYCNLGQTYVWMKNHAKAEQVFKKVLDMHPRNASAKSDLGVILMQQKKFEEAKKYLEEAIDENPKFSRSYFHLGQLYQTMNKNNEAAGILEKFCDLEEENNPTLTDLGKVEIQKIRALCKRLAEQEA